MMVNRVGHLEEDLLEVTRDAKVVALRWDLVPWGLVLDLDAPVTEAKAAPVRRVWLAFLGCDEILWPFTHARLPNGCWLTSHIATSVRREGFTDYRFTALCPQFNADDICVGSPTQDVLVRAQGLVGVSSENSRQPSEFGLVWRDRISLATDEELLEALGKA